MVINEVQSLIQKAALKIGIRAPVFVDVPTQKEYGDFATNIALKSAGDLKKKPLVIAQDLIKNIEKGDLISEVKIIGPGFINIWVNPDIFMKEVKKLADNTFTFSPFHFGPEKKVMVEFAHPNTLKLFHIGHMRNISTGESIVRLLEATGNKVIRSNYQGDVGLHIAKTIWKTNQYIKELGMEKIKALSLRDKIALLGKAYAEAETAFGSNEKAKKEILEVNKKVYEEDPETMKMWNETRSWSLFYFNEMYTRMYSHYDRLYFESECHKRGSAVCAELLKKGLLEKSEGAVIFNGKKYGVDTRVFVTSQGFPTYEGKEMGLSELEFSEFGKLDKCIHVVTPEQSSFFKVTFKVEELINSEKYKNKQQHLAYNWVKLKEGKMSSRLGNVIEGSWLIDEAKKKLQEKFTLDASTAEILAVASIKYSFLKVSTSMEIFFDFDESISLEGNSAPYLIYTYVRTQSILNKEKLEGGKTASIKMNDDENQLQRKLNQYTAVVYESASKLSPNILSTYLFELSQLFNLFYQKNPILKSNANTKAMRIMLTRAVGNTVKHGLNLLGIKTVEKM